MGSMSMAYSAVAYPASSDVEELLRFLGLAGSLGTGGGGIRLRAGSSLADERAIRSSSPSTVSGGVFFALDFALETPLGLGLTGAAA